jgi:hypothetical protein
VNQGWQIAQKHRGGIFPAWQFNVTEGQEAVKQAGIDVALSEYSHENK